MNFSVFIPIGSVPIVLVSSAEYLTQTKCVLCRSIMVVSVAGAPKGFRKNLIEYRNYQSEFNHFFYLVSRRAMSRRAMSRPAMSRRAMSSRAISNFVSGGDRGDF